MASFDDLKLRGARKVLWLELDGIISAFGDGAITNANKATLFTDALTPQFYFQDGLQTPRRVDSREIKILRGDGRTGGFEIPILDVRTSVTPDGYLTWLFGCERPTILRTRLTADVDHAVSGGHWHVADTGAFPASQRVYCELETADYGNKIAGEFQNVTRAVLHSHAVGHKELGDTTIWPEVADHPLEWQGRGGTLFTTFMDENGVLAGTPATARAVAHKTRGVLKSFHESGGVYVLTFAGIDTLLDRNIGRGMPSARVMQQVEVINDAWIADAPVMALFQKDIGGANPETFWVRIAKGIYTVDRFIEAVNQALSGVLSGDGGAFSGALTITRDEDRLGLHYCTDAVTAKPLQVSFRCRQDRDLQESGKYWTVIGVRDHEGMPWVTADEDPVVGTNYDLYFDAVAGTVLVDGFTRRPTVLLGQDADDSPIADFVAPYDGDYMVIRSKAGDQLCVVWDVDTVTGLVTLQTDLFGRSPVGPTVPLKHEGSYDDPIRLMRVYYGMPGDGLQRTGACGETALCLLLSCGVAGYNADAIYDSLPEGCGIEFPHMIPRAGANDTESWIDVASFERFFGEVAPHISGVIDLIIDPIPMRKWLTARIAFLGGYLVVENGQLRVRKGLAPMQHEGVSVTEGQIRAKGTRGVQRSFTATAGGVRHSWDWDWQNKKFRCTWLGLVGNLTAGNEDNIFEYEDKGLIATLDLIVKLQGTILSDFGLENPVYTDSFDGSTVDLEAGQVVLYSDEGAAALTDDTRRYIGTPNLQGTRGHNGSRMMTLSAKYSHDKDSCDVTLLQVRRKRGGFAPSAWIESFATVAGKSVLTCSANVFGPVADGVDVGWFTVGDLVRVVRVNPTLAGADPGVQTQEAGLIVESVDTAANTITLTATMAIFAPPIAGRQLAVFYDEYVVGQTARAKNFVHVSDGGDINGTTDEPYDWG